MKSSVMGYNKDVADLYFFPTYSGQNSAHIQICATQLKSMKAEVFA